MTAIFLIICVIPFTGICAADNSVEVRAILAEASSVLESDPKRASGLANRALKLCDTAHPDSATIAATVMYGEAEQLLGNFDLSIHILYDAEGLIKDGDTQWKARLYKLQGRVFSKLGDYQKSAELNDRATSMFRASGDSALVADCYKDPTSFRDIRMPCGNPLSSHIPSKDTHNCHKEVLWLRYCLCKLLPEQAQFLHHPVFWHNKAVFPYC